MGRKRKAVTANQVTSFRLTREEYLYLRANTRILRKSASTLFRIRMGDLLGHDAMPGVPVNAVVPGGMQSISDVPAATRGLTCE